MGERDRVAREGSHAPECNESRRRWDALARTILSVDAGLTNAKITELVGAIIAAGWRLEGLVTP